MLATSGVSEGGFTTVSAKEEHTSNSTWDDYE